MHRLTSEKMMTQPEPISSVEKRSMAGEGFDVGTITVVIRYGSISLRFGYTRRTTIGERLAVFPWFRLIRVGIGLIGASRVDMFSPTRVSLRVWPNDLDVNFHVNNGRYLALADIGRLHWFVRNRRVIGMVAVRGVFKGPDGPMDPGVLFAGLAQSATSPELPEWTTRFQQSSELLSESLREEERAQGLRSRSE